jgi:hypothetical protein
MSSVAIWGEYLTAISIPFAINYFRSLLNDPYKWNGVPWIKVFSIFRTFSKSKQESIRFQHQTKSDFMSMSNGSCFFQYCIICIWFQLGTLFGNTKAQRFSQNVFVFNYKLFIWQYTNANAFRTCSFSIGQIFGSVKRVTTWHLCARFQLDNWLGNAKLVTTLHPSICFQLGNVFGFTWMWKNSRDPMPLCHIFLMWNFFAGVLTIRMFKL